MYTYVQSELGLWTVGDYDSGQWNAESDHASPEAASKRVHYLNGGRDDSLLKTIDELRTALRIMVDHADLGYTSFKSPLWQGDIERAKVALKKAGRSLTE